LTDHIRNEIPRAGVDEILRVGGFADRKMVSVDAHRVDIQQTGIAAIFCNDNPC
jgi:hypothetical protein